MNEDVWKNLFTVCHALYAPMRVLCLADQKTPAMDKLHYFVCQTDDMLPKYLAKAEEDTERLLFDNSFLLMTNLVSDEIKESSDEEDDDSTDDDSVNKEATNNIDEENDDDDYSFVGDAIGMGNEQVIIVFFSFTSNLFLYSQFMQLYRSISNSHCHVFLVTEEEKTYP